MMISEKEIDKSIDQVGDKDVFIKLSKQLIEQQSAIVAYYNSESFEILSEEEKDLLWYCTIVIFRAVELSGYSIQEVTIEQIQEAEEHNYSLAGDKDLKFTQIADVFFDGYPEEDLLAFAEDTLIPDEEEFPSPVGRKVMFITLKTIIDLARQN